jgi:hypothetical protein
VLGCATTALCEYSAKPRSLRGSYILQLIRAETDSIRYGIYVVAGSPSKARVGFAAVEIDQFLDVQFDIAFGDCLSIHSVGKARRPGDRSDEILFGAEHFHEWCAQPNGWRLSCAAVLCYSQLQFYYDGRRQLQPLVRLQA